MFGLLLNWCFLWVTVVIVYVLFSFFYPFVLVGSFSPLEIAYIFVLSVLLLIPWRFLSKLLFFIKYKLVIA